MVNPAYLQPPVLYVWLIPLLIWTFLWKAMALYKAGTHHQLGWFILLFLVHTAGILDLLYILFFQRDHDKQ